MLTDAQRDRIRVLIAGEEDVLRKAQSRRGGTVGEFARCRGFNVVCGISLALAGLGEEDLHKECGEVMDRISSMPTSPDF